MKKSVSPILALATLAASATISDLFREGVDQLTFSNPDLEQVQTELEGVTAEFQDFLTGQDVGEPKRRFGIFEDNDLSACEAFVSAILGRW
ncbi:hypothetical protein BT69DRAFT_413402 [Atractiella rhizophila]|nr:hypothetical protein BT69DRAFT_413402 [Atractiella rhizophila]